MRVPKLYNLGAQSNQLVRHLLNLSKDQAPRRLGNTHSLDSKNVSKMIILTCLHEETMVVETRIARRESSMLTGDCSLGVLAILNNKSRYTATSISQCIQLHH